MLTVWTGGCLHPHAKRQPDLAQIFQPAKQRTGKTPLIVIPGILGSQLINKRTGEKVWPRLKPNEEELQLPVSPDLKRNRDEIVATDVLERVKLSPLFPEIEVYEDFFDTLEKYAGYKRGNIDEPAPDGYHDTFYLFAYDWRRDNVESAQLLAEKITRLKQKLRRPNLAFNVIAHSMGGLVARYYLMYGDAELGTRPQLNWAGSPNVDKLIWSAFPTKGQWTRCGRSLKVTQLPVCLSDCSAS